MNRREFIKVIAGSVVAAEPLGAFAQTPPKQLRIGVVAGINRGLWDPIELGLRENWDTSMDRILPSSSSIFGGQIGGEVSRGHEGTWFQRQV